MDSLQQLSDIGFRKVGSWGLLAGAPVFSFESDSSSTNVLYAFVSAGEVLYIGKTTLSLHRRMYGYQRPGRTQHTNIAGRAHISELLHASRPVDIYALIDGASLKHGAFTINLAAGPEDTLIRGLQPRWNKVGK